MAGADPQAPVPDRRRRRWRPVAHPRRRRRHRDRRRDRPRRAGCLQRRRRRARAGPRVAAGARQRAGRQASAAHPALAGAAGGRRGGDARHDRGAAAPRTPRPSASSAGSRTTRAGARASRRASAEAITQSKEVGGMPQVQKIAVAGATGRLGRPVVDILESRGHDVVPISRSQGVDVITGEGSTRPWPASRRSSTSPPGPRPSSRPRRSSSRPRRATCRRPGARAGVRRLVVVSIIGIDAFAGGYNAAKVAHEQAAAAGPIPARIVRAAQFHEFVEGAHALGHAGRRQLRVGPCVRSSWRRGRSPRSSSTWPPRRTPRSTRRRPRRSPARARSASSRRRACSSRGAASACGSRRRATPPTPTACATPTGRLLPGPGAKLAGPTFAEWLEATVPTV